jgi:hypothetical protein
METAHTGRGFTIQENLDGYMIWPILVKRRDNSPLRDASDELVFGMHILDRSFVAMHRERLAPGAFFLAMEGSYKVAEGRVISWNE